MYRINVNKLGNTIINGIDNLQEAENTILEMNKKDRKNYHVSNGDILDIVNNDTNAICMQLTL